MRGVAMRADVLGVRLNDNERQLLEAAALKEDTTQSAIARRGAIQEARNVLTSTATTDRRRP